IKQINKNICRCPDGPGMFATSGAGNTLTVWDVCEQRIPLSVSAVEDKKTTNTGIALRWAPG
ncbi:unnamed protein product, partial [Choristocarpus tenellus]